MIDKSTNTIKGSKTPMSTIKPAESSAPLSDVCRDSVLAVSTYKVAKLVLDDRRGTVVTTPIVCDKNFIKSPRSRCKCSNEHVTARRHHGLRTRT